ncbi:MAG: PAS domain S-box protein [Sediminibacterium sp.]|nr:PAS domain S-box protein [Sediminibacterium sp.]
MNIAFNIEQFDKLFPFYFLINKDGRIESYGKSLGKLIQLPKQSIFSDHFKISRPALSDNSFVSIQKHTEKLLILEINAENPIQLRGQFEYLKETDQLVFIGSPWFNSMEQVKSHQLNINDFAIHDPLIDLLHVLKTQEIVTEEVKELLSTIDSQRKDLKRLSVIAEESTNAVIIADKYGKINWANKAFKIITGYTLEEVIGKKPGDLLQGKESDPETIKYLGNQIKNLQPFVCEIINYHKSGRPYWTRINGQPLFDQQGNSAGFFAIEEDITEERIKDEKIKAYDDRFRLILEKIGDNVWQHDFKTGITEFSQTNTEFLEYTNSNLSTAESWWMAVHPDDKGMLEENDLLYKIGKLDHHSIEYRMVDKKGNIRWILDRGIVTEAEADGKPLKITGTHTDITKLKEAEVAFELQRSFYESILNNIPTDIAVFDKDHRYLFLNPIAIKDNELRKWMIGKRDEDYCAFKNRPLKIAEDRRALFNKVTESKKLNSWEETLVHPDGTKEYFLRNMYPVLDENDEVKLVIGYGLNITDRKNIEEQFKLNEKRYRDLFNYSQALICTHDTSGIILTVNPAICDVLGYTKDELIGKNIKEFIPVEFRPRFEDVYQKTVIEKGRAEGVFIVINKNKEQIYLLYQNYKVEEQGSTPYIIGFSQDITKRIKAEQELMQAKETTEKASKVKEIFLANMSHEIRTPMNGILGIGGLLYKTNLNPKQAEYTKLILESANNLLHIVNDVLDLTKIESGKVEFENIPFDLTHKISNTLKTFIFKVEEKGLALRFENNIKKDTVLIGDPFRLGQVLNNLISNAVKFTQKGSITLVADQLNEDPEKPLFQFKVKDTGIGISSDQLPLIFQEFVQASSDTSRKFGGTGLGLSISKNLIEMQGGNIKVESTPNEGTTFIVNLPYKKGDPSLLKMAIADDQSYNSLEKKRILVAEDVVINQIIVKQILEDWGHEVVVASNGREAFNFLLQEDFDLILMDIHMPEVDGYEATQMIRQLKNTSKAAIPIVALTANAFKNETDRFAEAGFNEYITKPFTEQKLFNCIKRLLQLNTTIDRLAIETTRAKPAEPSPDSKLYDLSGLYGMDLDDIDFIKEIAAVFIKNTKADILVLKKAIADNNINDIYQFSHRMKSSIYSLGIKQAYKTVESIEFYAKTNEQIDKIPGLFEHLSNTMEQVFKELTRDFSLT